MYIRYYFHCAKRKYPRISTDPEWPGGEWFISPPAFETVIYKQKILRKNIQTKYCETKISSQMSLSLFSVGHLLLGIGLPLSVVFLSRKTLLEKTKFFFVSSCQLERALRYVVGACVLLSQCWDPI